MDTSEHEVVTRPSEATETRRTLLRASLGGFALAASGLFLPDWLDETEARKGALDGATGGRHGQDHKGRHRHRSHGDKKDKGKGHDGPPKSHGPFRACALTVVNSAQPPLPQLTLHCTFYYRIKTGLDSYGPLIVADERTLGPNESFRYAPDRFRVGVLIKHVILSHDVFADVRNMSFWVPQGSLSSGPNLDPPAGKTGSVRIPEQGFDFGERIVVTVPRLVLGRKSDSDTHIEWELGVVQL